MKSFSTLRLFSFSTLLLFISITACMPATQPPDSPTLSPAITSSRTSTTDTPVPATPSSVETLYESEVYGFRLQIPAGYRVEELPLRNGILFPIGFAAESDDQTQQYGFPFGLKVYEKPAEVPFLDWFSAHIGALNEAGQPTSEEAFFYEPIVQNQNDFKGNRALQYESGMRPVPYETVIDQGAWAIGFYYLRDYPYTFDPEPIYDQMLASLEFFDPIGRQPAAATPLPPTATPTVCLDESAKPRVLPPRETPLEVQFISDGNVWVWEEKSGSAQQISDSGDASSFSFSPDGQVIIIERQVGNLSDDDYTDDYKVELWAVNRDGNNLRQLVSVEQFDSFFAPPDEAWSANAPGTFDWIPGTHKLVFSVYPIINALGAGYGIVGYWMVDADTAELQPTDPPHAEPYLGPVSPDGSQVALTDEATLSLMNIDGTNLRKNIFTFFSKPASEGGGWYVPNIYWTLDSQALFAITFTDDDFSPDATFTTWYIPVDGLPVQELHTFLGLPYSVYHSPNQKYLAYQKRNQPYSNDLEFRLATFNGSKDILYAALYNANFDGWHPDSYHFVFDQYNVLRPMLGSVCGGSVALLDPADTPATQIQWVDATRFLFVKGSLDPYAGPRELRLGQIGGPSILIGPFNGDYAQYFFNVEGAPLGQE